MGRRLGLSSSPGIAGTASHRKRSRGFALGVSFLIPVSVDQRHRLIWLRDNVQSRLCTSSWISNDHASCITVSPTLTEALKWYAARSLPCPHHHILVNLTRSFRWEI